MIASNKNMCNGHRLRLEWVEKLKSKVDLYGRGFKTIETKEEGLCDYMFSVAIENATTDAYYTEKILDCFATGTVPVYYGTDTICEYFDCKGIIKLDDKFDVTMLTKKLYLSMKQAILTNLKLATEFDTLEDYMYIKYLSTSI